MKKILQSLLFLLCVSVGYTQSFPCDIAQTGLSISPSSIAVGQTADFKFSVFNAGSSTSCTIPANTAQVVLSLPRNSSGRPRYYQFVAVVSPVGGIGNYFTYTYSATDNVVIGTNQNPIPNGTGELDVTIRVAGIEETPAAGATSTLNLAQDGGISNNTGNDISSAPLIVTGTILPIKLGTLQATSKGCQNNIEWTTLQEENTRSFTVESSKDGLKFKTLGTVAAAGNSTSRKSYSYTDAAPADGITYYRLKMIDVDNKYVYSDVVKVWSACGVKSVSIYPNPLLVRQQQLTVTIGGYKGQIKGELLSATGQVVQKYTLRNGANVLTVGNLSLGSYILRVTDIENGESESQKILVIR